MGKKKCTKLLGNKEEKEDAAVEQKQSASSTPKKAGNEIDEIFSGKKRKRPEQVKTEKSKGDEGLKPKSKKKNKDKSKGGSNEGGTIDPARPRKKTEDGLVIYTEEELGMNKSNAGGTPLCPFDCDCCF
ncbi:hypothetical protein SLEP1_g15825 [Rubroshorea leprosula]|uniref:DUF1764 domain-containing protein n=1 Tax=Rubroshorea leprosula TaxID=152421 RepID=A0AAV5IY25_9ROSI|nr:hypothetical protein SLEP1_g15825 [Rubroshorea leprosula]